MGGFFLLFLCVCARLVDVQIVRQKELTARGVKQWTRSGVVAARRGDIVDTNGRLLAQSVTSFIQTARPRDVKDAGALAKVLARELGLDEETILKKLSGSRAASVTLARQLSREDADRLRAIRQNGNSPDAEALIGITFDEDASRWYPMGTLLAQTLGLCNVDGEGQSGLELQYNDVLAGKPGKMITEVDARARTLPDGVTLYVPAEQGNTLRLTIDRDVQAAVERAARECAQVNDAVSVQAIAMDVNTGALLAMAMYPHLRLDARLVARAPAGKAEQIGRKPRLDLLAHHPVEAPDVAKDKVLVLFDRPGRVPHRVAADRVPRLHDLPGVFRKGAHAQPHQKERRRHIQCLQRVQQLGRVLFGAVVKGEVDHAPRVRLFRRGRARQRHAQQEQQRNPSFQHLSFPSHRSFLCVNLRRSAAKSPTISPCPRRMYL